MSGLIVNLNLLSRDDVKLAGGKAASLGEMLQAGIPVPRGFVITTEAFRTGMTSELKKKILAAFDNLGAERVAVRSSAVAEDSKSASWAGQLESYLNITRETVIDATLKCWKSMESEHAAEYAHEHNVTKEQQAVAVVVQRMVDSEVSGVAFTANPVTANRDEVVIETVHGLGEMLVQGLVTPENLVIDKTTGAVMHRQPTKQRTVLTYKDGANQEVAVPSAVVGKPVLSEEQLGELVGLVSRIEQHYKAPQDIEWAISGNDLYIVQSRPITALNLHNSGSSVAHNGLVYCACPSRMEGQKKEIMDYVAGFSKGPLHPFNALPYGYFEGGRFGRDRTMEICCRLIDACDEFWLFGISEGTLVEAKYFFDQGYEKSKTIRVLVQEFDRERQKYIDEYSLRFRETLQKLQLA